MSEAMNDSRIKHKSVAVKDVLILGFAFLLRILERGILFFHHNWGLSAGRLTGRHW